MSDSFVRKRTKQPQTPRGGRGRNAPTNCNPIRPGRADARRFPSVPAHRASWSTPNCSRRSKARCKGGPLSPLLANILLDDFDKELESRGLELRALRGRLPRVHQDEGGGPACLRLDRALPDAKTQAGRQGSKRAAPVALPESSSSASSSRATAASSALPRRTSTSSNLVSARSPDVIAACRLRSGASSFVDTSRAG